MKSMWPPQVAIFLPSANGSCGKVMFLHLSVSHFVHRGGCLPQCMLRYTPGRYASYWNALLFMTYFYRTGGGVWSPRPPWIRYWISVRSGDKLFSYLVNFSFVSTQCAIFYQTTCLFCNLQPHDMCFT